MASSILITDPDISSPGMPIKILTNAFAFNIEGIILSGPPPLRVSARDDRMNIPVDAPIIPINDFTITDVPTEPGYRICRVVAQMPVGSPTLQKSFLFAAIPPRLLLDLTAAPNSDYFTANRFYGLDYDINEIDGSVWKSPVSPPVGDAGVVVLRLKRGAKVGAPETVVELSFLPDLQSPNFVVRYENLDWNHQFPMNLEFDRSTDGNVWPMSISVNPG